MCEERRKREAKREKRDFVGKIAGGWLEKKECIK